MFKALIFLALGAAGMYLYMNPGDITGLQETARTLAHDGATWVQENTK